MANTTLDQKVRKQHEEDAKPSLMKMLQQQLMEQLNLYDLGENQKVVFESPGRVLNETDFQYTRKGPDMKNVTAATFDESLSPSKNDDNLLLYNELRKPLVVKDKEFELTDFYFNDLPDTETHVTRAGGIPGFVDNYVNLVLQSQPLWPDYQNENNRNYREGMKASVDYLNTEVEDKDGNKTTIKNLFIKKKQEYSNAKMAWAKEKNDMLDKAENGDNWPVEGGKPFNFERYTEWLAQVQEGKLDEIEVKLQEWVLEGQRHEVFKALEIINQGTVFEMLEECKENLEINKRVNLAGDGWVYRVNMSPSNWANYLRTDIPVTNLCDNPEVVLKDLAVVTEELKQVIEEISRYTAQNNDDETKMEQLITARNNAEKEFSDAKNAMMDDYTDNAVFAVDLAIKMYTGDYDINSFKTPEGEDKAAPENEDEAADEDKAEKSIFKTTEDENKAVKKIEDDLGVEEKEAKGLLKDIGNLMKKANAAQSKLETAQKNLSRVQLGVIGAKTRLNQAETVLPSLFKKRDMLSTKKAKLEAARDASFKAYKYTPGPPMEFNKDGTPKVEVGEDGKPKFQDDGDGNKIPILKKFGGWAREEKFNTIKIPEAPKGWTDISLKIDSSTVSNTNSNKTKTDSVDWNVNALVFSAGGTETKNTGTDKKTASSSQSVVEMGFRVAKVQIERGQWFKPDIFTRGTKFSNIFGFKDKCANMDKMWYPTSMLVARDITVSIETATSEAETFSKVTDEQSNSGGGCAFFSVQRSSAASSNSGFSLSKEGKACYNLTIGSPQIIGWQVQKFFTRPYTDIIEETIPRIPDDFFYHPAMLKDAANVKDDAEKGRGKVKEGATTV